jgi:hypothetical protein
VALTLVFIWLIIDLNHAAETYIITLMLAAASHQASQYLIVNAYVHIYTCPHDYDPLMRSYLGVTCLSNLDSLEAQPDLTFLTKS